MPPPREGGAAGPFRGGGKMAATKRVLYVGEWWGRGGFWGSGGGGGGGGGACPQALRAVRPAGGLAEEVDEKVLHAAFIPFGDITDIQIPLDYETGGWPRGSVASRGRGGEGGGRDAGPDRCRVAVGPVRLGWP